MDGIIRRRRAPRAAGNQQQYWSTADHYGYLVRVRRPQRRSVIRLTAALVFVSMAWVGASSVHTTNSHYMDTETSTGNTLAAATFNLELDGQTNPQPALACGEQADFSVQTHASASLPVQHRVYVQERGGSDALCGALELNVKRPLKMGGTLYSGPLSAFPGTTTEKLGSWAFSVSLPEHRTGFSTGEQCIADIVFSAWRANTHLHADSGYTDRERVSLQVHVASTSPLNHVVDVINDNRATVTNAVDSSASSGGNTASDSYGGDGARGGDMEVGTSSVRDVSTGNGGSGGESGAGGVVESGPATSSTRIENRLNRTRTGSSTDDHGVDSVHATSSSPQREAPDSGTRQNRSSSQRTDTGGPRVERAQLEQPSEEGRSETGVGTTTTTATGTDASA